MSELDKKSEEQKLSLALALVKFDDELTVFNDDCAFLCDAFSSLVADHPNLDQCSIQGFGFNACRLKQKAKSLTDTCRCQSNPKKIGLCILHNRSLNS